MPVDLDAEHNLEMYGRHYPFGTITPGNGSERCWYCGVRDAPGACHAWIPSPTQACCPNHAQRLVDAARVTRQRTAE